MLEAMAELRKIADFLGSIARDLGYFADKARAEDATREALVAAEKPAPLSKGAKQ